MSTTGNREDVAEALRTVAERRWDQFRMLLLVGWLLVIVAVGLLGERTSSWNDLTAGVASGAVTDVRVVGAMTSTGYGYSSVDVHWSSGPFERVTEVVQIRGRHVPSDVAAIGDEASAVLHAEPGAELLTLQPGLDVTRSEARFPYATLGGWRMPGWLGLAGLVVIVAGFAAVGAGPRPWRATRWGWFWLQWTPIGGIAYALLSGPTPGLALPRVPHWRIGGGLAIVSMLVINALLAA